MHVCVVYAYIYMHECMHVRACLCLYMYSECICILYVCMHLSMFVLSMHVCTGVWYVCDNINHYHDGNRYFRMINLSWAFLNGSRLHVDAYICPGTLYNEAGGRIAPQSDHSIPRNGRELSIDCTKTQLRIIFSNFLRSVFIFTCTMYNCSNFL